ncbi:type I-F CRISPR-associated endoribonuclease Cas6/Csy4 [Pseudoxanthomonas broegbernensis]|uniref:Type I-F CRISPR-associated endoribonuclease Cas6/Csy4 n=1 Tax=Pseudoxanthomonas broegbernensis TaxID=83619 RepID=A0A7V8GNU1_9GAMM|nr:type I-F CRISPR-associated endoribonuclease Cas6/Csy4 [Pseudoxanthomonas broegbernensis]KAF1687307.1 type I-F CRISPR-associated endoribonuclease Cas6/Csy4 [Pseudoxanthomonas broegbernensis]MBB6065695.1 CRISPR-associated endonuclease Csy4 [Pseudoxanthomonas broegbernensis]
MGHYLDIQLRPDPELTPQHLLNGLYARLHRTLVLLDNENIGISFPKYEERMATLGTQVRLHGPETSLRALTATTWLNGMLDYLRISEIEPAPTGTRHRHVSRVQAKSNPARLRRRAMRRHGLDEKTATDLIPDSAIERLRLPFVMLGSRSTGQPSFPLFIQHGPLLSTAIPGKFNSYGLSREATVPWF